MDEEDKEEVIKLTKEEGAIIFKDLGMPEIYAPIGVGEVCDSIRFTLAFILYAVDREDWVEEFCDNENWFLGVYNDSPESMPDAEAMFNPQGLAEFKAFLGYLINKGWLKTK